MYFLVSLHRKHKRQENMIRIAVYSILYLFGIGENPISMHSKSDYQAIQSDWQNVGMDIYNSMQKYGEQQIS